MTIYKEDAATDVDAVQIWSVKELEGEFSQMLKAYRDKETELNWEERAKSGTRLRGLLRGNATEAPYLEVLLQCVKQMVDGIVKAAESLRTKLAVKTFTLIEDISIYIGKHLDNYTLDQILLCMMRCSSISKKMVASASFKATNIFIKHTHFYPKIMNMLSLSMSEKNSQIRLYAIGYLKTLLQTHAHQNHTRQVMDRTNGVMDHFENILTKGLNDPTPVVKEACREVFWIFCDFWRERGDHILKQLPLVAQKQLEKSKTIAKQPPMPTSSKSLHSPTGSPRTSSSLGRHHHDISISPSNSNTSNGSSSSHSIDHHQIKRSMSPRLQQQHYAPMPSSSTSPTPPSNLRKTRVPTLNRKKSAIGLITKRKPHFMTLLNSDDVMMRGEGLVLLSKKLVVFPYAPTVNLQSIHMDVPNAPPVDGSILKSMVLNQWEENYEVLSSWDSVTGIMLKLLTFEEYIPKLILDAHVDESARRSEADIAKYSHANLGLIRAKLFMQCENPDLIDILFTSLVQYGGFVTNKSVSSTNSNKKDITRLPANRRKLTKQFLEWMDELVTPLIGLNEDVDYSHKAYEGVPDEYTVNYAEKSMNSTCWFESDDNVRQCLAILLPLITTSTSGTMWHAPLITFMKHIRLLNQRLFENVTATYDEYAINKICRVLGIHIRIEPPVALPLPVFEEEDDDIAVEDEGIEDIVQVEMDLPILNDDLEEDDEIAENSDNVTEQSHVSYQHDQPVIERNIYNAQQPIIEDSLQHLPLEYHGHKPVAESMVHQPITEYTAPPVVKYTPPSVLEYTAPLVEYTAPVVEYTEPVMEYTAPIVEYTAPIVEYTAPVVEYTAPVVEYTAPVVEYTAPVVEYTAPVVEYTAPVVEYTAPVVEYTAPVVEYTAPVVEYTAPVVECTTPIVESTPSPPPPTVEHTTPFAQYPPLLPPVAEHYTPVVQYASPVVEHSVPIVPVVEQRESAGMATAETHPVEHQTMIKQEENTGMVVIAEQAPVYTVKKRSIVDKEESAGVVTVSEPVIYESVTQQKLSMQERNNILDHDIPVYFQEKMLPPSKQEITEHTPPLDEEPHLKPQTPADYFSTAPMMNGALSKPTHPTDMYEEYGNGRVTEGSEMSGNILKDASILDIRTVSNASAEPHQQQQNNNTSLPCSVPNVEKYPIPVYVSFFAPEKVNYPNPVFQQNARTVSLNGSTTTNGRNLKDKTILLYALIDKLKQSSSDHHNTFRKLIRLFKDVPIRRRWDQGGIEESGSETWAGSNGDAGNFVELVQSILYYLDNCDNDERYLTVALECIRQLAVTQVGLFRFYETKVDKKGMTLESQLMEKLLQIRSNENPTICIAAEDALDAVLSTLTPLTAFEMLMAFIIHRLLIAPCTETSADVRYHPVGSAFMYLGKWVKEMNEVFYIDEWLNKGGVNAFFKGMNHSMINIRKSCVEAIVSFHEVIGDKMYMYLVDLREDQLSLLKHYVAKALKKKATLRNLRDNGQF